MAQQQQQQHKKSQKQFETLFAEGLSLAADNDDKQAATEKFLQAVRAAPLVWARHRFYAFATFLASISDSTTQSNIELITKDFIENETEPAHFRASATFLVAHWYTLGGSHLNLSTAADVLRKGLDIIASSPNEDDNRKVLYHPHISLHMNGDDLRSRDLTLKSILSFLGEKIQTKLSLIFSPYLFEHNAVETMLLDRARAGGMVCDCCGKTLEELQMISLQRCGRCKMVFYCSPACQREHWKGKGHNRACREEGQIEIGDDMQLARTEPSGLMQVVYVNVISSSGGDLWQIKPYGSEEVFNIDGAFLTRLRPPSTL